ncbi:ATP-binding protein [Streptomyces sp. SID10853]|uniref:ATP-binding protein n=1 Tax=Streptomyces sp. SID10853 TaxID=2706028 RepID=UPI001EF36EC6|nr:ATP-binding protein [Streptomyces sp. SID10853]
MTPAAPRPPQGGEFYRIALPNTANASRIARDFVTSLLTVSRHGDLADDARLCVAEVVTNAHRHTRTPRIQLYATVNRKQITVSVADNAPWFLPVLTPSRADGQLECGRGLLLVAGSHSPGDGPSWAAAPPTARRSGSHSPGPGPGPGPGPASLDSVARPSPPAVFPVHRQGPRSGAHDRQRRPRP